MVTPKRRTRCSQYEVWGDVVSDTFVNSWTEDVPRVQQTCSPCYERPNFVYGLLDYLFAKETVTRNAVVGTVFVGSGLPDYHNGAADHGIYGARAPAEGAHHGRSALRQFCARTRPGNAGVGRRVVHHGVTGIGKVSPTVSFSGAKPRPRMNEDAAVAQRLTVGRGEGARRFWRLL